MLHIEVFRVAGIPDSETKVWFVDRLSGACDRIGLFFASEELKAEGVPLVAHALTIQAQGWAECPEGLPGNSHPPVIRVKTRKVKPGGERIEIRDSYALLAYQVDEGILTDAGALGLQEALQERVRRWVRADAAMGYVSPEQQHQLG